MATLLPNGKQTFLNTNGAPLAGGSVTFYVPGTSTLKNVFQDAGATTLNTNPVTLDASGQAIIYGTGAYRQVVKDVLGNIIWDQSTADTASSATSWGGTSTGTANLQVVNAPNFSSQDGQKIEFIAGFTSTASFAISPNGAGGVPVNKDTSSGPVTAGAGDVVAGNKVTATYDATAGLFHITPPVYVPAPGSLINHAGNTAPQGYLACDGSTVSRTGQAALFAAIGTLWGVGNGSTTFTLPNAKGRALIGVDAAAAVVAGATTVGATLGEAAHTQTLAELATHDHGALTGLEGAHTHVQTGYTTLATNLVATGSGALVGGSPTASVATSAGSSHRHSISSAGGGSAFNVIQPSMAVLVCIKT